MARSSPKLQWCIVRTGDDLNWWVEEISDETHWDVDGLGIIDPRQISHVIDLCEPLRDYGFDTDVIDQAFFPFALEKELEGGRVRLKRSKDSLLESDEQIFFALPDIVDEEKGPYADFLDQITRARVKMLNDLIDFDQNLTIEELEEEIRERQNAEYFEGRAVHFFNEITAILEYVPEGFELDQDEETGEKGSEDIDSIPDLEEEESIEEDETMKWEEESDEEDISEEEALIGDDDEDEDEEDELDEEAEEEATPGGRQE